MIVDPDFPDHWKTRLLVDMLDGDEVAPVYLIRLWAHCQNRRISTFENLPPAALKALCRYPGHSNKLESALATSGFVRREGPVLHVCEWEDYNAALIANWTNGKKGGRPRKPPAENPDETHGFSTANPSRTDKIGLDRKEGSESAHADDLPAKARTVVDAYPRKEKLSDALTIVLRSLQDGENFEAMLAGTKACAAVIRTLPTGPGNRYVPSAESFFRAKRWQDDPETLKRQGNTQTGQGQMDLDAAKKLLGGRAAYIE